MDSNPVPPVSPPPPPNFTPPPIISPPTPPPRRRGRGWMVLAIILLLLLGLSVLGNIGQLLNHFRRVDGVTFQASGRESGPRLQEVLIENNNAVNKIAVIRIDGIITSHALDQTGFNMVDLIKAELKKADQDRRVKAVILKVDSPGGEVLASDEINRLITDFQAGKNGFTGKKPVIASMENLAASGGYYVSVPCRWIVANELTITGSIGVILHSWNYRGLMDKIGLAPEVYKSGKFKDMLSGSREPSQIPPEEHQMVQSLIDEVYGKFKEAVARGRNAAHEKNQDQGRPLASDWQHYADGRVLSGSEAFKLGFVDELGDFDAAVKRAKILANIRGDANVIQYQQRYDISDFLRLFGEARTQAPTLKLDLGFEPPKLEAGQLYFLAPTFLH